MPFYLLSEKSSLIESNRMLIEAAAAAKTPRLDLSIAPELVDMNIVSGPQEIVLALQHIPRCIEKLLGAIEFDFPIEADSGMCLEEEAWKKNPRYIKWFHAMASLECMPFFVRDKDIRLYMLAGDYLAEGKSGIGNKALYDGHYKYEVKSAAMFRVSRRLFDCCVQFMIYCHNTGFDPKLTILSMLADYTIPVHYADIYRQYKKEIMKYSAAWKTHGPVYRFRAA